MSREGNGRIEVPVRVDVDTYVDVDIARILPEIDTDDLRAELVRRQDHVAGGPTLWERALAWVGVALRGVIDEMEVERLRDALRAAIDGRAVRP